MDRTVLRLGRHVVCQHRGGRLLLPVRRGIERGVLPGLSAAAARGGGARGGRPRGRLRHFPRRAAGRVRAAVETGGAGNAVGGRGGTRRAVPAVLPGGGVAGPDVHGIALFADPARLPTVRAAGPVAGGGPVGAGVRVDANSRAAAGGFPLSGSGAAMVGAPPRHGRGRGATRGRVGRRAVLAAEGGRAAVVVARGGGGGRPGVGAPVVSGVPPGALRRLARAAENDGRRLAERRRDAPALDRAGGPMAIQRTPSHGDFHAAAGHHAGAGVDRPVYPEEGGVRGVDPHAVRVVRVGHAGRQRHALPEHGRAGVHRAGATLGTLAAAGNGGARVLGGDHGAAHDPARQRVSRRLTVAMRPPAKVGNQPQMTQMTRKKGAWGSASFIPSASIRAICGSDFLLRLALWPEVYCRCGMAF